MVHVHAHGSLTAYLTMTTLSNQHWKLYHHHHVVVVVVSAAVVAAP